MILCTCYSIKKNHSWGDAALHASHQAHHSSSALPWEAVRRKKQKQLSTTVAELISSTGSCAGPSTTGE